VTSTQEELGELKLAKFQAFLSLIINKHRDLPSNIFNACAHGEITTPCVWMTKGTFTCKIQKYAGILTTVACKLDKQICCQCFQIETWTVTSYAQIQRTAKLLMIIQDGELDCLPPLSLFLPSRIDGYSKPHPSTHSKAHPSGLIHSLLVTCSPQINNCLF